jgi:ketopantoate reductase
MSLRIAAVGSGAIGSYYGAKLAYGGSDVLCAAQSPRCRARSAKEGNLLMNTNDRNVL